MAGAAKARRRARERRQTVGAVAVFVVALILSIGSWVVFFKAWTPWAPAMAAPPFALPASTGQTVALGDFAGKQDVVLVFYMVAT